MVTDELLREILVELKTIHKHLEKPEHWIMTAMSKDGSRLFEWDGPPDKPEKPSILTEEWVYELAPNQVYDTVSQCLVDFDEWRSQIAALPDALRALNEIVETNDSHASKNPYLSVEHQKRLVDNARTALKKAGIE